MIKETIYVSLIVQLLTFFAGLLPFIFNINSEYNFLKQILSLELIVQVIEIIFYIWFASSTYDLTKQDISKYRYYDWMFTTPIMLVTTAMLFIYLSKKKKYREKEKDNDKQKNIDNHKKLSFSYIFNKHIKSLSKLITYNAIMLLFGYINEVNITKLILNKPNQLIANNIFIIFGFVAFYLIFHELYKHVKDIKINKIIFYTMIGLWFMYGIAALFKNVAKNTMYNILDIFSKNFYGLFLSFYVIYINGYD
jgi:hypothetical protein